MAQDFEKTNLPWELRLWQQRTGEWIENLASGWKLPDLPEDKINPQIPSQVMSGLFWVLLIAIVGLLVWKLYPVIENFIAQRNIAQREIEVIPTPPVFSQNQWLQQAHSAKAQGDYAKAARALYFATLTRLQDRELITTADSLTNGEYRTQLRKRLKNRLGKQPGQLKTDRAYQTIVNTHEAICYGDRETIDAQRYEDCDRAYRDIEQETR